MMSGQRFQHSSWGAWCAVVLPYIIAALRECPSPKIAGFVDRFVYQLGLEFRDGSFD